MAERASEIVALPFRVLVSSSKRKMGQVRLFDACISGDAAGGEPGNQCGVERMKSDNVC